MLRNNVNKWTKKTDPPPKNSMFFLGGGGFGLSFFYYSIYNQTKAQKWIKVYFGLVETFVGPLDIDFSKNLTKKFFDIEKLAKNVIFPYVNFLEYFTKEFSEKKSFRLFLFCGRGRVKFEIFLILHT